MSRYQLDSVGTEIGLSDSFLQKRWKVNERRTTIIESILVERNFDLSNADVLEVGSHLGLGLLATATIGIRVGLEYFQANCRAANILSKQLDEHRTAYVRGTAVTLPFRTDQFDFVYSHHVIEHMPPELWPDYVSEMGRVVKTGGICLLSFPQWHFPIELHYRLPFLHWLPEKRRTAYLRLLPGSRWAHQTEVNSKDNTTLIFTELPKAQEVVELAKHVFTHVEDVTREFAAHTLMKEQLGRMKQQLALLLIDTWLCPERKLLLRHTL